MVALREKRLMRKQRLQTEVDDKSGRKTTGICLTSINLTNAILGSGIAAVALGLRKAGFGLGVFLIVFLATVIDYSLVVLIRAGRLANAHTYPQLGCAAFGRCGYIFVSIMAFLYPLLIMVSYVIIVTDQLQKIVLAISSFTDIEDLQDTGYGHRAFLSFLIVFIVMFPISLTRDVGNLYKYGSASLVVLAFVLIVISVRFSTLDLPRTDDAFNFAEVDFVPAIGLFVTNFMVHHAALQIWGSMTDPKIANWKRVTDLSIGLSLLYTLAIATVGYSIFTGNSEGDILQNFCTDDILVNFARGSFMINVILTFPVHMLTSRQIIEEGIAERLLPVKVYQHVLLTLGITIVVYLGSLITSCLGIVLEFVGIFAAVPLMFILPPILLMKLQQEQQFCTKANVPLILTEILGLAIFVGGLVSISLEIASGDFGCLEGKEPEFCIMNGTGL